MKEIEIDKVINVINKCTDGTQITNLDIDKSFSEIGIDSIVFIRIIVTLEEEFACEFPDSKLIMSELNTTQKIFNVIKELFAE